MPSHEAASKQRDTAGIQLGLRVNLGQFVLLATITFGIALVALAATLVVWVVGALLMGVGMALLYSTLLAAVSDVAAPRWRATSLGVYRLWRDSGYAFGALAIGIVADAFELLAGFWFAAAMMIVNGLLVAIFMYETLPDRRVVHPTWQREPRWQ